MSIKALSRYVCMCSIKVCLYVLAPKAAVYANEPELAASSADVCWRKALQAAVDGNEPELAGLWLHVCKP